MEARERGKQGKRKGEEKEGRGKKNYEGREVHIHRRTSRFILLKIVGNGRQNIKLRQKTNHKESSWYIRRIRFYTKTDRELLKKFKTETCWKQIYIL